MFKDTVLEVSDRTTEEYTLRRKVKPCGKEFL